jgi:hypothetical protein
MICINVKECEFIKDKHNNCPHTKEHVYQKNCDIHKIGRGQGYNKCADTYCIRTLKNRTK